LTSIVGKNIYYGSQWDQKLVTDILLNGKKNRLNGFENGKTQLFNSGGVISKKKWSITLSTIFIHLSCFMVGVNIKYHPVISA